MLWRRPRISYWGMKMKALGDFLYIGAGFISGTGVSWYGGRDGMSYLFAAILALVAMFVSGILITPVVRFFTRRGVEK